MKIFKFDIQDEQQQKDYRVYMWEVLKSASIWNVNIIDTASDDTATALY